MKLWHRNHTSLLWTTIFVCFQVTVAELKQCDRNRMAPRPKIAICSLQETFANPCRAAEAHYSIRNTESPGPQYYPRANRATTRTVKY